MVESKYDNRSRRRPFRDFEEGEGTAKGGKRRRARSWKLGTGALEDLDEDQDGLEEEQAWYDEFESEEDR